MKASVTILQSSLIGDALCLGSHWIYSQREIAQKFGEISGYAAPATSYHPGKQAGDFTHYGDQTLVLLRSLAKTGRFDLATFAADWRAFWEAPETHSYRDGATKSTLLNLQKGLRPEQAASPSNDIAGQRSSALRTLGVWNKPHRPPTTSRELRASRRCSCSDGIPQSNSSPQSGNRPPSLMAIPPSWSPQSSSHESRWPSSLAFQWPMPFVKWPHSDTGRPFHLHGSLPPKAPTPPH
jgi:hypothetical protein